MSPPTTRFSNLSLESMPPTTRSHSQQHPPGAAGGQGRDSDSDPDSSDGGENSNESSLEEDSPMVVRSPKTNLVYNISNLPEQTQELVRQLFHESPQDEPPQIVLQWCQLSREEQGSQFYAFQMHEIVPRSVRIGGPESRYPVPRCNCMRQGSALCKHLITLLDQINYHTSYAQNADRELTLEPTGYTAETGSAFDRISAFDLSVLAEGLHCDVGPPESKTQPSPQRLREAREILAAVAAGVDERDDEAVERYRRDLFDDPGALGGGIIARGDLEQTVLQMLLANNDFFAYFLRLLAPNDRARDPFRWQQQRVDRVLSLLDAHSISLASTASPSSAGAATTPSMPSHDVPWAATHLLQATQTIQALLQRSDRPPEPWERASAARVLVRTLRAVVFSYARDAHPGANTTDRNLYQRLIGSSSSSGAGSGSFVVDALALLPDQNQYIDELESIEEAIGVLGCPEAYLRKLRGLIARLRSNRSAGGSSGGGGPGGGGGGGAGGSRGSRSTPSGSRGAGSKRTQGGNGREGGAKRVR
ncbi:SWIM zinc finger protein [Pleurostoma richardsiae]|uniref:SWIM zinc finger protein n=1 Tax=Pleurostoma richardsiae TaxID=41990 RepID=A0AA38VMU5_9PEZI|nr:SWIM zinc finger protein [Pleurostoma richardsiae]